MEKMNKKKSLVFLDVSIDGDPFERMVFKLFPDVAPRTAENFRALCTGEKGFSLKTGKPLHYKGTFFHRIVKGHGAQGGDFLRQDGNYGESIYDGKFPDESPKLKHDGPGLLSMSIADRDERGSLFSVTFKGDYHLDRKCVVFGKLVDGLEVLKKIEDAGNGDGKPAVTVKIINSGELNDYKKKRNKLSIGKDTVVKKNHEVKRKGKNKKSSKRRKRRKYDTSETYSSTDTDTESSESDSDSDSYTTSSSDTSSSSDDRCKKRKRSRRDKHRRGKKKDRRREKLRKRRDKKSKQKSKRNGVLDGESDGSSSEDIATAKALDGKQEISGNQYPLVVEPETVTVNHNRGVEKDISEREEGEFPRENGNSFQVEMEPNINVSRRSDVVAYLPRKSRSQSLSPRKAVSKSMSISPGRSPGIDPKRNKSRSPNVSRSPQQISDRSRSNSPARSESSRSPVRSLPRGKNGRSVSRSPVRILPRSKNGSSVSRSPVRSLLRGINGRNVSRSPPVRSPSQPSRSRSVTASPLRKRVAQSPPRTSSRRSSLRSASRSPVRSSRRSISRSPIRSRKSASRSSGRAASRQSPSLSPVRSPIRTNRRSYSRSPVSAGLKVKSPVSDRGRSSSRSPVDGSPKRIRRGRGFSDQYSYVRRYRSRSRDHSSNRSYRYGGRGDRYSSYRRSPRRYRSPIRARTPPRYRGRRSRTRSRSVSHSPIRYRKRRHSRSRSSIRSVSPVERYRVAERRRSPSPSKERSVSKSSHDTQSPRNADKVINSKSPSSERPARKTGLVSYGDGSPDSSRD